MTSLTKKGYEFTFIDSGKEKLTIELTTNKVPRNMGWGIDYIDNKGVIVSYQDETYVLPVIDPVQPNVSQELPFIVNTLRRVIELGSFCEQDKIPNRLLDSLEEVNRMLGVHPSSGAGTFAPIPFANGEWEYLHEDGYRYTLQRRHSGNSFLTKYIRTIHHHSAEQDQDSEQPVQYSEERIFFLSFARPVTFERLVSAFNL